MIDISPAFSVSLGPWNDVFSPELKAMKKRNLATRIGLSFQQIASGVNII